MIKTSTFRGDLTVGALSVFTDGSLLIIVRVVPTTWGGCTKGMVAAVILASKAIFFFNEVSF
jgi:hypothetical protein